MAAVYRYLAYDLRTGSLLEELPLSGVRYTGMLNRAGSLTATLPLGARAQTAPGVYASRSAAYLNATQPGRTVIYVERDGVLIDGYIVWTRNYQWRTLSCQLGGMSLWSYFAHRIIDRNYTSFNNVDQFAIVQTLINDAQSRAGGSIGVVVGTETSGVLRVRNYYAYEAKPVGEAIQQLAEVNNGFDFNIDVAYVAGVPTATLRCSYPRRGRLAPDSGLVFEAGRNIIDYQYPEDATDQANRWFGLGAGDGTAMLISPQARPDVIDAGYPLLDGSTAWKDISDQSLLDAYSLALVNAKAMPVTIPSMDVTAAGDPQLGQWIVGDYATFLLGTDSDRPDPRFPSPVAFIARIVGYEATPGDEGQETVRLITN